MVLVTLFPSLFPATPPGIVVYPVIPAISEAEAENLEFKASPGKVRETLSQRT
jgi:hypothetical protein